MFEAHRSSCKPAVSIVMAVYDPHPEYFRKAIESILAQRFANWELIIVEDPSLRLAAQTLAAYSDDRIVHIANLRRTSLVEQRNRAFAEARGPLIAIMDADDIAHPFRLLKQLHFLRSHPEVDVVGSQVSVIDSKDRLVGYRWFPALHDEILRAVPRIQPLCQPTVMMRRDVIDRLGGFGSGEFFPAEDYEYWSRLLRAGIRFANLPEPLHYYRIHDEQLKQLKLRETIRGVLRVRDLHWSDRLDLRARLQTWGEHAMLWLPKSLVTWLLLRWRWHVRPSKPDRPAVPIIDIPSVRRSSV